MSQVLPHGYRLATDGYKEPPYPYQDPGPLASRTFPWTPPDPDAPLPSVVLTIGPAAIERILHPAWPEAMRAEEV